MRLIILFTLTLTLTLTLALALAVLLAPVANAQSFRLPGMAQSRFLPVEQVLTVEPAQLRDGRVVLTGLVAPENYLYRHSLKLEINGQEQVLELPAGMPVVDEFFGQTEVYRERIRFSVAAGQGGQAILHWQGCADAGLCYPPQTLSLTLPASGAPVVAIAPSAADKNAGDKAAPASSPALPVQAVASAAGSSAASTTAPVLAAQHATVVSAPPPTAATGLPAAPSSDTLAAAGLAPPGDAPAPVVLPEELSASAELAAPPSADEATLAADQSLARDLAERGLAVSLLVFFGLGLLLAFTPCTLPMLPIVSAVVLGGQPAPRRALLLAAAYVLPMALTYAALGVLAGLGGANLQAVLQHPLVLGALAGLFVMFALVMFGVFELQLPAFVRARLDCAGQGQQGGTVWGASVMGLLSALLVGPCMTAPLAGALLYIGASGDPLGGGLALFALGLGMGLPLLGLAVFGARVLPRPGPWMNRVKAGFGLILLGLAVSTLERVLPAPWSLIGWGSWWLMLAVGLLALAGSLAHTAQRWSSIGAAVLSGLWGVLLVMGGAGGGSDGRQPLAVYAGMAGTLAGAPVAPAFITVKSVDDVQQGIDQAVARGQWTLVDFYADWCVSCRVIEREVFTDPEVAALMARMQLLRPDVTAHDPTDRELLAAWQVPGPPTLLLVGPDGREHRALRTTGEIGPRAFAQRLRQALEQGEPS